LSPFQTLTMSTPGSSLMQNDRFFLLDLKAVQTKRTLGPLSKCAKFVAE
jgi:hypothetical protein